MKRIAAIGFVALTLAVVPAWALDPGLPPGSNFDLSHWYLGLPVDSSGGTTGTSASISTATLTNGYTSEWFYTGPDGAMVFWAWVVGATTSGSSFPRSELRELIQPPDTSVNWIPYGTHILDAQCQVLEVPSTKKVIIGQIHAYSSAALPTVKINYNDGAVYGTVKTNSTDDASDLTFSSVSVGLSNNIAYQIKVVNGLVSIAINGITNSLNVFQTDPAYTNETQYFKAGDYCQDNSGAPSEGARVAFYALGLFHAPGIASQPASQVATLGSNVTFTVGAFGNGTLTYQWWLNASNGLSGTTGASLTITNVTAANVGDYAVVVSDDLGSVTSAVAYLSVTSGILSNSYSTPGSVNWTCPDGVSSVQVECWGAGGAGGSGTRTSTGNSFGGGGAGGAYARANSISVIPGSNYTVTVGTGGVSTTNDLAAVPGGESSFSFGISTNCLAKGGAGGTNVYNTGTAGRKGGGGAGSTAGCIGDVMYAGGGGYSGQTSSGTPTNNIGGGGGGSGGTNSNGNTATTFTGAAAGLGGGAGGDGKAATSGNGSMGTSPGGAGGGARGSNNNSPYYGGAGRPGQVVLTYTVVLNAPPPVALTVTPASVFSASGPLGGPFGPSSQVYTLTNSGDASLSWSAGNGQNWLSLSAPSGTLPVGGSATVTASINSLANSLAVENYSDSVTFTNLTNGAGTTTRPVTLAVFDPLLPPAAPLGLAANAVSINQINLSWIDRSPNEDGFRLERAPDVTGSPGTWIQIATVSANVIVYYDTGLTAGTKCWYRVRAYNAVGNSGYSYQASAVTPCPTALVTWGNNSYGQALPPDGLSNAVSVAAGYYHSLALKSDGTVVGWGDNGSGQRVPPAGLTNAVAIAAGFFHSLALKSDGTVVGWGDNGYGQTVPPASLTDVVAIAAGGSYDLALKSDGTVVGWGDNGYGQTVPPASLTDVVAIAAGSYHGLALKSDGTVVGWGANWDGQASPPDGLSNVVAIAAGHYHSLALKSEGTLVGWGANWYSQASPPDGLSDVVAIAAGLFNSLALKSDGIVVGWGDNGYGQAVPPAGLTDVVTIVASYLHSLALTLPCSLNAPYALAAAAVSSSQINLSWTNNSSSEAGFKIERAPDNGGSPGAWAQIATVGANISTYSNTTLLPNTKYWYRVRAYIAGDNSPYSNEAGATTLPLPPSAPSSLTATAVSASRVDLSWTDNSTNEDGFKIERATSSGGPWSEISIVSSNVTAHPDTGVTCSQTYFYRIRAYNAGGPSSYSSTANASTETVDTDGDKMPDCLMLRYFGHPTAQAGDSSRAQDDADGDGCSNLQEFQVGTDPTNSASAFRILSIVPTNVDMLVSWTAGGGRTNIVQAAPDLTGSYTNVSPNIVLTGSGDVTSNYLDAGGATNASAQFYRIRLVP